MASSSESESDIPLEEYEDESYNLEVSIAVTEAEGEEIEDVFNDALSEIRGEKSFPCSKCEKVCKSKGGLTRHTNSKHSEIPSKETSQELELFCLDTIVSIVETIKSQIIREKLYGAEICERVNYAAGTEALFKAVYPLYANFFRKKNQDQLVESFFALVPQSCALLKCEDYKAANLIMIHIPDHLVGFYNTNRARTTTAQTTHDSQKNVKGIDQTEHGPLSYVAGYIVSKLFQSNKRNSGQQYNEELHQLLLSMKATGEGSSYISSRSRGGLVNPSSYLVGIIEEAEHTFRKQVCESRLTLRNIPVDTMCNATLQSPMVKSLWENIVMSAGVNKTSSTQKLCLENVIKLFLRVRAFSYARDYLNKYKIKEKKISKKALRKDMKLSAEPKK